jgi:hypothetical protein
MGCCTRPPECQTAGDMSAPKFAPTPAVDDSRSYSSPPVTPKGWTNDRPGAFDGFQPAGAQLGSQGPDQGFALKIAADYLTRLHLQPGEHSADVVKGCLGIALRRASMFSRAPVVHDLTVAFTIWGFLDASPPADLLAERRARFSGLGHGHYTEARSLTHLVPEATLRLSAQQASAAYPAQWKSLVGL